MTGEVTEFFRCMTCGRPIEVVEFLRKRQSKCRCGSGRFIPTVLTPWEVFKYLVFHPAVTYETIKFHLGRQIWERK